MGDGSQTVNGDDRNAVVGTHLHHFARQLGSERKTQDGR